MPFLVSLSLRLVPCMFSYLPLTFLITCKDCSPNVARLVFASHPIKLSFFCEDTAADTELKCFKQHSELSIIFQRLDCTDPPAFM